MPLGTACQEKTALDASSSVWHIQRLHTPGIQCCTCQVAKLIPSDLSSG